MFFTAPDKLIYTTPSKKQFDPLALQRKLVLASHGKLNDHLAIWQDAKAPEVDRARAEEGLVAAARPAFDHKPFDADGGTTDNVVLADLEHFLEWLEGKDLRGSTQRP